MQIQSLAPTQVICPPTTLPLLQRLKDIPLVYHFLQRENLTHASCKEQLLRIQTDYLNTYQADAALGTYLELKHLDHARTLIEAGHRGSPPVLCQLIKCGEPLLDQYLQVGMDLPSDSDLYSYFRIWEKHILLLAAARVGNVSAAQTLLETGSDTQYRHPIDLPYRAYSCHHPKHMIGLLTAPLAIQMHPLRRWPNALDYAVGSGNLALVDLLLRRGAESKQALLIASIHPNPLILKRLLESSWIDLEVKTVGWEAAGETALLRAAIANEAQNVRILLDAGANPKAKALLIKGDKEKPVTIWDYSNKSPRVLEVLNERGISEGCTIL